MEADEKCKECGKQLDDEEYITSFENHGGNVSEQLILGYECSCGYKEEY